MCSSLQLVFQKLFLQFVLKISWALDFTENGQFKVGKPDEFVIYERKNLGPGGTAKYSVWKSLLFASIKELWVFRSHIDIAELVNN